MMCNPNLVFFAQLQKKLKRGDLSVYIQQHTTWLALTNKKT